MGHGPYPLGIFLDVKDMHWPGGAPEFVAVGWALFPNYTGGQSVSNHGSDWPPMNGTVFGVPETLFSNLYSPPKAYANPYVVLAFGSMPAPTNYPGNWYQLVTTWTKSIDNFLTTTNFAGFYDKGKWSQDFTIFNLAPTPTGGNEHYDYPDWAYYDAHSSGSIDGPESVIPALNGGAVFDKKDNQVFVPKLAGGDNLPFGTGTTVTVQIMQMPLGGVGSYIFNLNDTGFASNIVPGDSLGPYGPLYYGYADYAPEIGKPYNGFPNGYNATYHLGVVTNTVTIDYSRTSFAYKGRMYDPIGWQVIYKPGSNLVTEASWVVIYQRGGSAPK